MSGRCKSALCRFRSALDEQPSLELGKSEAQVKPLHRVRRQKGKQVQAAVRRLLQPGRVPPALGDDHVARTFELLFDHAVGVQPCGKQGKAGARGGA